MSTALLARQTRQQRLLMQAYTNVRSMLGQERPVQESYGRLCHRLPVLVRVNGLCQSVAFIEEKGGGGDARARSYQALREHLARTVGVDDGQLLDHVWKASVERYIADTRAVLAAWVYYKRFAVSILKVEADADEEGP